MIGRFVWFAVLIAIALVTAALQIDMQSRRSPQLAALVPAPLRGHSQVHVVRSALAKEDPGLALGEAKRLLQRRPMPAENLVLLATAQAKAGKPDDAMLTIQIAGQRGWREPLAQEAVLRLALSAGDKPEAARRYAALFLREQTPDALLQELGPAVLDEAGGLGQQTMVAIVVGGERWHPIFLRRGISVMPSAAFSAIAAESLRQGAAFECPQLAQSIKVLKRNDPDAGERLQAAAARRCPELPA